ncbi:MAG: Flp pilus assembly complex ATPase component TadA [Candidatus Lokiarchaeota archaeon]|nr:Flp pilus assembly complex ATPase component TadA [Candidatus Lokiarchaeota archaeon]
MSDKYACDTSVIFNGLVLNLITDGELGEKPEIYIPNVVVAEVEYRTNVQKEIGFYGLNVLKELRKLHQEEKITLNIVGKRPTREEIKMSPGGELDALIRKSALEYDATLITADRIQGDVGIFEGIQIMYVKEKAFPKEFDPSSLKLLEFFDETTMSVHLKQGLSPYAKKGSPGNWRLEKIGEEPLSAKLIEELAIEIIEMVREDDHSFVEIEKYGAVVAQLREFRIVITRPPFSNDVEITAVHPLVTLTLKDYSIDAKLNTRLQKAEGILVAGAPGAGKSTFSAALANYYLEQGKVVKTLESVRDLQVKPEITQYTKLEGSLENSADILLLVRPDFTIFDEVRTTKDFQIYADFRLSGVGMVGVVHSSSAIDAIQRFIGRIELGMLPSIIDTIVFIEGGDISAVLVIKMTVKVPHGFRDKDLARPVVEVRDFRTTRLAYEIYSFGQDIVINPINPIEPKGSFRREEQLKKEFSSKKKRNKKIELDIKVSKQKILITADPAYASSNIIVYADDYEIFTGSLSRSSVIALSLSNKEGRKVLKEYDRDKHIYGIIK